MSNVRVLTVPQQHRNLGRQLVHDERSRSFARGLTVDRNTWRNKINRLYDPWPNPNQPVGCCTGVAKCNQFNALGNRVTGVVLNMNDALDLYRLASRIDPFYGEWEPTDTGSSGLASAQAAQRLGLGGEYRWYFGGADEVVQGVMNGEVVSVGTWWYEDMMYLPKNFLIRPTGAQVGGHQYVIRGYDNYRDRVMGRCWWGTEFKDFWMQREDLDALLKDDGDAHYQVRIKP